MEIKVKEMIASKKITIRKAAMLCGIRPSTLIDICAGKVLPRLDTLENIAQGLNCYIEDLYSSPYKRPK